MSMFQLPNKFLSEDIYKTVVPDGHFLRYLDQLLDWQGLSEPLYGLAKNAEGGRPRHNPVLLLKMLFLSFLFNASDRETEEIATMNLACKFFLHLPINEAAPDHSTLSRFRDAVLLKEGVGFFDWFFGKLVTELKEKGVVFGSVHALDATHTLSKINGMKDSFEKNHYESPSKDHDASWGCKGDEMKLTIKGEKVAVQKNFFGYKAHLLAETTNGLITGFYTTTGKMADLDGGDILMHRILTNDQRMAINVLLADKGYGCPVWINFLEKYSKIMTAFSLPEWMLTKGEHQAKWQTYEQNEGRRAFRKDRYIIERVNADLKNNHSLRRARYLGLQKYHLQTALASAVHNAKLAIRLLTGVRFKPI